MKKKDIWTALWYADQIKGSEKLQEFLRSLIPTYSRSSTSGLIKLAFVIGHNRRDKGAYAYPPLNISEYDWSKLVAKELVKLANENPIFEVKIFTRLPLRSYSAQMSECYKRVNAWNPDLTLESHFNYIGGAGRVEMLHAIGSDKGEAVAKEALDIFGELMNVSSNKRKLLPTGRKQNGGLGLYLAKSPCVLLEPFDCSNETHNKKAKALTPKSFAKAIEKLVTNQL